MQRQRRPIVLLRWLLFGTVSYLLFASFPDSILPRLGLLAALAASNVGLGLAPPRVWQHRALLPSVLLLDTTMLTGTLYWSGSVGTDFFLAYFIVLAIVAFGGGDLRWTAAGALLIAVGYAVVLGLDAGAGFWRDASVLVRLPFLFVVAVLYGSFAEAASSRAQEAEIQKKVAEWVRTLTSARVDRREAHRLVRHVLAEVDREIRGAYRVSLVRLRDSLLTVIFSSDDSDLRELPLDLSKYPEIDEAIRESRPVVIEDLADSPTTAEHAELLRDLPFSSVLVCPDSLGEGDGRHLLLRVARVSGGFTEVEVDICQQLATAAATLFRHAEMRDQIERAERLQMLAQMAAGVAHDFNNILCSVLMSSQLLREETAERLGFGLEERLAEEDDELLATFDNIELAAKDGMTIVERLSSWSRLDHAGAGEETKGDDGPAAFPVGERLDPESILREAWKYAEPRWLKLSRSRDLELRWQIVDKAPIHGNGTELREAMLNLILNAVDAMPRGGTLTLGLDVVDETVTFTVRDTGVGIPEELQERIFEPLFTTKGTAGTGLGLSIVRSIAHDYGGRLDVDSSEGTGSRFVLALPRADFAAVGPGERDAPAASSETIGVEHLTRKGKPDRILLVEDNRLVRDTITRYLEASGYLVDTAGTAHEAEILLGMEQRYSALVLDVNLPDRASPSLYGFLEENRPELVGRAVFYSSGEAPDNVLEIQSRFEVPFVNKNLGLAAVGEAVDRIHRDGGGESASESTSEPPLPAVSSATG